MRKHITTTMVNTNPARRVYRSPQLNKRGSVQQLTLKIGSVSDGMGPHSA